MGEAEPIHGRDGQLLVPTVARKHHFLDRAVAVSVYLYTGLAALHWASVAELLNRPPEGFFCGNVIIDPLGILMNNFAPIVAACVGALVWKRVRERRRPLLPVMILPTFLGTTITLVLEAYWLRDYENSPPHSVWWVPRMH
jgi:uncharacterized membrane protein YeaQ/YmgE (transglycosylase-associated protein family)